jgi:hypothetical protein
LQKRVGNSVPRADQQHEKERQEETHGAKQ